MNLPTRKTEDLSSEFEDGSILYSVELRPWHRDNGGESYDSPYDAKNYPCQSIWMKSDVGQLSETKEELLP